MDDLTPEEDARIRDLLASTRETGPVPPDVAARLDARLAALTGPRRTPWVRRHASRLLVAAVVVVVAGVGGTFVVHQVRESSGGQDTAAGASASSTSGSSSGSASGSEGAGVPRLTSRRFARQVTALLTRAAPLTSPQQTFAACGTASPPAGVAGRRVVLLDGRQALLDVYAAQRGQRLVRAVTCSGDRVLASARVPAG